ncbi:hypothetical protein E4U52_006957 [Claviceps spartinae]|nr:hypothetical protein E4U52_006957 [Claviceps spartinae]
MLGDFRKLYRDGLACFTPQDSHVNASSQTANSRGLSRNSTALEVASGDDNKLGDFRKLRWEFRQQHVESDLDVSPSRVESLNIPHRRLVTGEEYRKEQRPVELNENHEDLQPISPNLPSSEPTFRLPTSSLHDCTNLSILLRNAIKEKDNYINHHQSSDSEWDSLDLLCAETSPVEANTEILSYKLAHRGPLFAILGKNVSLDQKYEALSVRLMSIRAWDLSIEANNHSVALGGVHVFLDMSNINISFQHALRHRYSIGEHSRFSPLPQLNLHFLTEIFVRKRRTIALNAGCSVLPDRHEPRFIEELRRLGYRVDLRERRLIAETKGPYSAIGKGRSGGASSDKVAALHPVSHFMEDLVDETLQTRIAESVMEYFEHPGTLVLATGDAQPAKYSDGFFTYAERALRMGWYVEVVSWNLSLSSRWRKSGLAQKWGDRFRLIKLDDFIDELLL